MPIIAFEEHAIRMQDETALNEGSIDVSVSMVTADSLFNQNTVPNKDKHDDNESSQHSHGINNAWQSHMEFKYVNVGRHINFKNNFGLNIYNTFESAMQKLNEDPDMLDKLNSLWQLTEQVMNVKYTETCKVLEANGIGDGEMDSETDEGQLWKMVQGDAPYTLNLT